MFVRIRLNWWPLLPLFLVAALRAGAGEAHLKLEVLRAEAQGSALDVLLRIDASAGLAGDKADRHLAWTS